MPAFKGSVAAPHGAPQSADEAHRQHLRAALPERLEQLRHAIDLAQSSLRGVDPEAALGHVALLRSLARRLLRDFQ